MLRKTRISVRLVYVLFFAPFGLKISGGGFECAEVDLVNIAPFISPAYEGNKATVYE